MHKIYNAFVALFYVVQHIMNHNENERFRYHITRCYKKTYARLLFR